MKTVAVLILVSIFIAVMVAILWVSYNQQEKISSSQFSSPSGTGTDLPANPPATSASASAEDQVMNFKLVNGRKVIVWVKRFGFGDSWIRMYSDHTGTATGYIFSSPADFNWRLEGRSVIVTNWKSNYMGNPIKTAEINSDATNLHIIGLVDYEDFTRE